MSQEAEGRWVDAVAVLRGGADPALLQRTRRRTVLAVSATLVLAVVVGVVAVLVSLHLRGHAGRHRAAVPVWREVLGGGLSAAGGVLEIVAGVRLFRSEQVRAGWSAPTRVLSRDQQRQLLAQVRGTRPVEPDRLPLLRDLAGRIRGQRHLQRAFVGVAVLLTGNAVGSSDAGTLLIALPGAVAVVCAAAAMHRDIARAGAFLARHPDGPEPRAHLA